MALVELELPGEKKVAIRAFICWSRPSEKLYGLRFDPADPARIQIRNWIDQYLEIV
jgi:hypothetical protein